MILLQTKMGKSVISLFRVVLTSNDSKSKGQFQGQKNENKFDETNQGRNVIPFSRYFDMKIYFWYYFDDIGLDNFVLGDTD